jgi:hypothetical protein
MSYDLYLWHSPKPVTAQQAMTICQTGSDTARELMTSLCPTHLLTIRGCRQAPRANQQLTKIRLGRGSLKTTVAHREKWQPCMRQGKGFLVLAIFDRTHEIHSVSRRPMNAAQAVENPGASPRAPQNNVSALLVGLAASVGVAIVVAAAVVPIVTIQSPAATSVILPGNTPSSSPPATAPATSMTADPRVTLLAHDGVAALGLAAIPLVVALIVGLLLRHATRRGSRPAAYAGWALAIILTLVALVGFVTIVIGAAVIPVGVLLILACTQRERPKPYHP